MNLDPTSFSSAEAFILIAITLVVGFVMASNYMKGFRSFWSPLTLLSIIFTYYCVLGPYYALSTGLTYDRLLNMRPYYYSALLGALVFLISFIAGFHINQSRYYFKPVQASIDDLFKYGVRVTFLGFLFFYDFSWG